MSIEAYDYGKKDGIAEERKRISDWIEANRSVIELDEDTVMYRDHFSSQDLLDYINDGETK